MIVLGLVLLLGAADLDADLATAESQIAAYDFAGAIATLERCERVSGRRLEQSVRLYEGLGIALASSGKASQAEEAFLALATIAPERAIRYTLSPKITFVFERARERAALQGTPSLQLLWPLTADANAPVPIDLEVLANPRELLRRGVLIAERPGMAERSFSVDLPPAGTRATVVVPPPEVPVSGPGQLRLRLVGVDEHDNEITRVGSAVQARTVALSYERPKAWYERRWVWIVSGVVFAGAVSGTVYALTREPAPTVPVSIDAR